MRILLVEDDEALAQAVGSYLRSKAFLIDSVPSLAQARACLAGASYAAVLLDLHLSDGDGLALMPTLRRRSEEHTSELQSQSNLVCRLLLEKKKKQESI